MKLDCTVTSGGSAKTGNKRKSKKGKRVCTKLQKEKMPQICKPGKTRTLKNIKK